MRRIHENNGIAANWDWATVFKGAGHRPQRLPNPKTLKCMKSHQMQTKHMKSMKIHDMATSWDRANVLRMIGLRLPRLSNLRHLNFMESHGTIRQQMKSTKIDEKLGDGFWKSWSSSASTKLGEIASSWDRAKVSFKSHGSVGKIMGENHYRDKLRDHWDKVQGWGLVC